MTRSRNRYLLLTIPALSLICVFVFLPLMNAIRLSFYKWNGYSQNMSWIGFDNFMQVISDSFFWRSFFNTLIYGFGSTLLQNIFGLLLALYLNVNFAGRNLIRAVVYLPIMISAFIMGQILYYFVQYQGGVFNEILMLFGKEPVYWMETGLSATILITLANSWQYVGLCMVVYLAGLQNIPEVYREAARLDGVGCFREFIYVTFPMLNASVTTAVVTNLIGGLKMYDVIVSMSGGGPNRGSLSLSYYIQLLYFNDERAGYAASVGLITFLIILCITLPVNWYLRKREVQY